MLAEPETAPVASMRPARSNVENTVSPSRLPTERAVNDELLPVPAESYLKA